MQRYSFPVDKKNADKRLDIFLVDSLKKRHSRSFIKKLIDKGLVVVNKNKTKVHHLVNFGEEVTIEVPSPEPLCLKPEKIELDILYEDSDLIVLHKPPGLVVHPAPGNYSGTLVNGLLYHCKDFSGIGGDLRPGIVHRLDKDTSGVIVVAKSDAAHKSLSEQFKKRTIRRIYIALVKGVVQLDNGIIELPIGRHPLDRKKMGVKFVESKEASTQYKVLKRFKDFTMLELKLGTGRTHQIRVHMSHLGHPLIGDKTYGSSKGLARQALHAKTLGFVHPATEKYMEFDSKIPEDMQGVIERGRL